MEQQYIFEPSSMEIILTELFGGLLMRRYYSKFVSSLGLECSDKVLDYCSGSGIISKKIACRLKSGRLIYTDVSKLWLEHAGKKLKKTKNSEGMHISNFGSFAAGGEYDKIVVHYVLHDFPKEYRQQILNQLITNLKQSGMLAIREPISEKHGFKMYEIVNLIESVKGLNYEYKVEKKSIAGSYIDIRCRKKQG